MINVSHKRCSRENQNTHFMSIQIFFLKRAVYEIMWKNTVQPDRPQMTIRSTRITCWITEATNTHSEYIILTGFPL